MGMTIDNSCGPKPMSKEEIVDTLKTMVFGVKAFERFNAKEREALDKAWNLIDQYEARLKADMVAMLEDLLMEVKHTVTMEEDVSSNEDLVKRDNVMKVVQFRINKLKETK